MISVKEDVVMALKSTGYPVYFFNVPSESEELPVITYFQMDNIPQTFADNSEQVSKIIMIVDIYSDSSTTQIAERVNCVMFELGFVRKMNRDIPDKPGIQHTTMRFDLEIFNHNYY